MRYTVKFNSGPVVSMSTSDRGEVSSMVAEHFEVDISEVEIVEGENGCSVNVQGNAVGVMVRA